MNILFNAPYDLFAKKDLKKYIGPLHFSSMFLNSFKGTKHKVISLVFKKTGPNRQPVQYAITKDKKATWLVFKLWVPTAQILKSTKKLDPETRTIINQIKDAIAQTKPDIFFLNGFSALTFLVLKAVRELEIPIVTTHHGIWFKEYMALKSLVKKGAIEYRKELERNTVKFADKNIFLSNLSLREFEKNLIKIPKNQLVFLKIPYNPMFANKTYPKPKKGGRFSVLMVGRWDGIKNHEAYLEIAKRAKQKKLPWTFYSVCNIGDYPHYNHLKKEYKKYIKVLPGMAPKNLKEIYRKSNITVLPSHFDVYPGVVTESILQNRPALISPNVGWIDEYRAHGIEHWITDFNNPDATIEKIKQVSQEQVPRSLYNEVLRHNNPETIFKEYFKLFEGIRKA